MQLCIDAGNTNIKIAVFNKRKIVFKVSKENVSEEDLFSLFEKYNPASAILSSVRKFPSGALQLIKKHSKTIILSHTTKIPVKLKYQTPETLGPDRIASAVAAWTLLPGKNSLVINAGTCVTFDIVDKDGSYQGGAITPGIEMRYKALHQFTAKLPYVTKRETVRIIGKTTTGSINAGVLNHMIYEINGAISFYNQHYKNLAVLLTGGDASFLAKRLKNDIFAAPDLVLTGLNEILLYNA
jgi:type III pantothenate kinase